MVHKLLSLSDYRFVAFVKDSSFLYMGRLLEGFGVGVISYTVIFILVVSLFVFLVIVMKISIALMPIF